jgi:hypothetical protein
MILSEIKKKLEQELEKLKEEGKDVVETSQKIEVISSLISAGFIDSDEIFLGYRLSVKPCHDDVVEEAKHRHKKGK